MFCPSTLIVCNPSSSFRTSSGVKPCTEFQYWDETMGILQIVKYWFNCSNVAEAPPRRQDTTDAPSLPAMRFSVEKNNLFVYGLKLNEQQKDEIRQTINHIVAKGYRWHTKIERENGFDHPQDYQEDYPSRLVYKTGAKFYKFRSGRFKTYFALGSNCVLLADSIIGRLGTDVLSMRGIITPGTYLDYLDKEYHKKGSMVVTRRFYPCLENEQKEEA